MVGEDIPMPKKARSKETSRTKEDAEADPSGTDSKVPESKVPANELAFARVAGFTVIKAAVVKTIVAPVLGVGVAVGAGRRCLLHRE